jgi:branched-chain amino acid aminotransferase
MHVIGCLKRLKFKLLEQKIPLASALKMDAAFITGTSRKVLPVNRIDNTGFPVKNKMLYAIMREFEKEVSDYLQRHS